MHTAVPKNGNFASEEIETVPLITTHTRLSVDDAPYAIN